ncbi:MULTISPECIES: glycosyltransferase family 4 protein [Streptomyces]|uniref:D-inositol 3-phosphate glycosyltransferase n=1 Tax=Streptomyces demainii TaxID=588122 RepID=A0ABT9KRI1_9ACTN|nr:MULTISPECIES: glycosyltransferase family 4 protein [Streptomyces]MDP9611055.1 glycosyltransferase involved in cell wall biosynthesis [Streptomyces demainii]
MSPAAPRTVHIVMPGAVADPSAPSGGNVYDRRICRDLPGIGWRVREHAVAGDWPQPGPAARAELARVLAGPADGTVVLLDGLVAGALPSVVVPQAQRLRAAVLVHLPLGDETGLAPGRAADLQALEGRTLRAVRTVVATSAWAAGRLAQLHGLVPDRVHVAAPGADIAPLAASGGDGSRLLCVASVTPRKGQLRLVEALAEIRDLPWSCEVVGSLEQDPEYAARLRELIGTAGVGDRVRLLGPRTGAELDARYASADVLVLASYAETYGMAVTEALARGIPVLATAVGGVPEAVGQAPGGRVPGMLVDPDDPRALAAALRRWLGDPGTRRRLSAAARERRTALAGWENTTRNLADALEQLRDAPRRAV